MLRPLVPGDARVLASWARDLEFCREAGWSTDLPEERHVAFWHRSIQTPPAELIRLGVVVQDALVGYIDLHGQEPGRRELGIVIGVRDRWGQGLGRRAASAALDHAFHDLDLGEVWAEALDANARSVRLLRRLGMQEAGRGAAGTFLSQPTFYRQFRLTASAWRSAARELLVAPEPNASPR